MFSVARKNEYVCFVLVTVLFAWLSSLSLGLYLYLGRRSPVRQTPAQARYCKKFSVQTGRGLLNIAAYKSIRYVLSWPIRPAPICSVRYRNFLPGLVTEFLTVMRAKSLTLVKIIGEGSIVGD